MLKAKRSLILVLIIGLISAMGTSIAKAEVGTFTSSGNEIYVEQGQQVTLENLTGQDCLTTCIWSVTDFDSGIQWANDYEEEMVGTANKLGAFDVELRGLETELIEDSVTVINIFSTTYRIYVAQSQAQVGGLTTPGGVGAAGAPLSQTITFAPINDQLLATGTLTVTATASSGLPVSFAATGTCTVGASTGVITFTSEGVCTITASQPGGSTENRGGRNRNNDDDGFSAAVNVVQTFTIRADQAIVLTNPGSQYFVVNATVSVAPVSFTPAGPRPVTFVSNTTGVCTVDANTGLVTVLTTGSCSITGTQAGTAFINADSDTVVFVISNKLSQTINFLNPGEKVLGINPFNLAATAVPSGLQVSYTSNTPNVCTVLNDVVTILARGTCSITASQAGNGTYSAATSITQPFAVVFGTTNTINVAQQGNKVMGVAPFNLKASASSGLTVVFVSTNTQVCTVDAVGLVTVLATGSCTITLSQPGNGSYPAADNVIVSFEITGVVPTLNQSITVTNPANRSFVSNETIQLDGRADSILDVVYSSNSEAICTVSATGLITIRAVGPCSIAVNQPGNSTYFPAPGKIVEFVINEQNVQRVPEPVIIPVIPTPPPVVVAPPVVNLNGLVTIYDGQPRELTPTAGVARCSTTYNGSRVAPRDAGTYAVVATCVQGGAQTSATSTLVIRKAKPAVQWFDPSSITTTTKLSRAQLNATANVAGTFAYASTVGSTLPQGVQPLKAVFTPRDTRNYESVDVAVNIVVTRTKLQTIVIPFDMGSSSLSAATRSIVAQIKASGATAVTVLGYVKPSSSLSADKALSLARANQVRAAVIELMPSIRVSVQALDRQRNPLCDFAENKCAVITE